MSGRLAARDPNVISVSPSELAGTLYIALAEERTRALNPSEAAGSTPSSDQTVSLAAFLWAHFYFILFIFI